MIKITFPHMGRMDIPVRSFFNILGFEVVSPPAISKKTLDLGVKYSPEFACLPLKINLGNFIEALEKGANLIVMGGGCGPCRFGYYAEVQKEILRELGYDIEFYVIEPGIINNYHKIRNTFGNISYIVFYQAARVAWLKAVAIDNINRLVLRKRCCESFKGEIDKFYGEFLKEIDNTLDIKKIEQIQEEYSGIISRSKGKFKLGTEIKIGIVGEIYLLLEPFVNLNLERKLGELGAAVEKEIYMTSWLLHFFHLAGDASLVEKAARKYLDSFVGGHGQESVGNTVRYAEKSFDGVIQLAPFTCMPEIISQSILPAVSREKGIPIMTLFFDEHSGDAGMQTRLEAFLDLLLRKKERRKDVLFVEKSI